MQKIKDEALYEHIISPKVKKCEKEEEIYKAAEALENIYGRGKVVVEDNLSTKGIFILLFRRVFLVYDG